MQQYADNPKLWRERAEEARVQAEQMSNEEARRACLKIAESYERLAVRAEERLARQLRD
jgi:hypothetical protein